MKESNFFRNLIKANCSSQQVQCSFDNPAEHNFLKVQKLFSQIQKKCKIFILNSLFSIKLFLWTRKNSFEDPAEIYSLEVGIRNNVRSKS